MGGTRVMRRTLDELLAAIAATPTDRRLDGVEGNVASALARSERTASPGFGWQAAAVAASLGIGTIVGGATATATGPRDAMSVFTPEATLAPSNLLGGGR